MGRLALWAGRWERSPFADVGASPREIFLKRAMITILTGGTGGAKFIRGMMEVVSPVEMTIIGNTGDDCQVWGLHVSPDLDTIMYQLAGLLDEERGWGVQNDTFTCLATIGFYGEPTWFKLGDRDLATHLKRTLLLGRGWSLTEITAELCRSLGVGARLLPMSNDLVRTRLHTPQGTLSFQEYFVRERWQPEVMRVDYVGCAQARAAPGVVEALHETDGVIIAPSNPITSIGPILSIAEIRRALEETAAPVVAVSPLLGGRAVSGPAARLLVAQGYEASPRGLARFYSGLIDGLLLDESDAALAETIARQGIHVTVTRLLMTDRATSRAVAEAAVACCQKVK